MDLKYVPSAVLVVKSGPLSGLRTNGCEVSGYLLSVMVALSIEAYIITSNLRVQAFETKTNERACYHPRKYFFTLNRAMYQGRMDVTPYFVGG